MEYEDKNTPPTKPTLKIFSPYGQTFLGFIGVSLIVALIVFLVQFILNM